MSTFCFGQNWTAGWYPLSQEQHHTNPDGPPEGLLVGFRRPREAVHTLAQNGGLGEAIKRVGLAVQCVLR